MHTELGNMPPHFIPTKPYAFGAIFVIFLEKVTEIYLKVPKYGRTGILETFYHILARVGSGALCPVGGHVD